MLYAEVYLPIAVNKSFSYSIPTHLDKIIQPGHFVYVPFNNKNLIGYVDNIIKNKQYIMDK